MPLEQEVDIYTAKVRSKTTWRMLVAGQKIFIICKKRMDLGSANIIECYDLSQEIGQDCSNIAGKHRVLIDKLTKPWTVTEMREYKLELGLDDVRQTKIGQSMVSRYVTKRFPSGNCQELADLTYGTIIEYAEQMLKDIGRDIYVSHCSLNCFDHEFVLMHAHEDIEMKKNTANNGKGEYELETKRDVVLVDPWPCCGQAVLFNHSYWQSQDNSYEGRMVDDVVLRYEVGPYKLSELAKMKRDFAINPRKYGIKTGWKNIAKSLKPTITRGILTPDYNFFSCSELIAYHHPGVGLDKPSLRKAAKHNYVLYWNDGREALKYGDRIDINYVDTNRAKVCDWSGRS